VQSRKYTALSALKKNFKQENNKNEGDGQEGF